MDEAQFDSEDLLVESEALLKPTRSETKWDKEIVKAAIQIVFNVYKSFDPLSVKLKMRRSTNNPQQYEYT